MVIYKNKQTFQTYLTKLDPHIKETTEHLEKNIALE